MEWLRSWALAAGCAAVAGGLALTLSPDSGIQRVFRLVLSAFFLCCLIIPLANNPPQIAASIDTSPSSKVEEIADKLTVTIDERVSEQAGEEIKQEILRNLGDLGINPLSLEIYIVSDRLNDQATSVGAEIVLERKYSDRHDELVSYLKNKLGIEVKLGYK